MIKVLACAPEAMVREIADSPVWREEFERQVAGSAPLAISAAASFQPNLILIDRELPSAEFLLKQLRSKAETRKSSIVVLSRGELLFEELGLLDAGANAVLRLPPSADWDERVEPLLAVPTRKQARLNVTLKFTAATRPAATQGKVVNLSSTGMLVDCSLSLPMGSEVAFRLELPGFEATIGEVDGTARIVRLAGPGSYGMKFTVLADGGDELIRRYVMVR